MNATTRLLRGGLFLLLVLTSIRHASASLITSAPQNWENVAVSSIWKIESTNEYLPLTSPTIGQTHSGHGPYDFFRAYMVFELPKFGTLITPDSLGLLPEWLGGHDLVTIKANGPASLHLTSLRLGAFPYTDLTVEFRQSPVDASELVGGKIELETAFQKLGQGPVLARPVIPFGEVDEYGLADYSVPLSDAFTDYINSRDGGQFVISFTLPFIPETRDYGDTYYYIWMDKHAFLETPLDFFSPDFSPVPEPSTYGLFAGIGLVSLAVWCRKRQPTRKSQPAVHLI